MTLSPLQVDLIKGDISQNGIELKDLQYDLLDHICCILELEGDDGKPFEEVYAETKKNYFPEGFREIQEQTNYLITQKYNNMKKVMNIIGIGGSAMLMIGSILKTLSMAPANELILLGVVGLTLGYLPILLVMTLKQADVMMAKFRNISGFLGAEAFIIGIFFQVLHLPGGKELFLLGLGIVVMVFIPLLVKSSGAETLTKLQPATLSVLLLAIVSTFFAFGNKKTSHNYRNELVAVNANIEKLIDDKQSKLEVLRAESSHSDISKKAIGINEYIKNLKGYIVLEVDPNNATKSMDEDNVMLHRDVTNDIMITNGQNHQFNGPELQNSLVAFQEEIKKLNPTLTSTMMNNESVDTWLKDTFHNKGLYSIYCTLSQLQLDVATLEMEALNQ